VYTLDTNAIIYYLKGDAKTVAIFRDIFNGGVPIYISVITELELFSFSELSAKEIENIDNLLKTVMIIPIDSRVARTAGFVRRRYKLKVPDSIIASTSMLTGTTLITRNIDDFKKIPALPLLKI